MATAAVADEPNEKECSVCHEQFTEPKLLPCGHLLCRHCLLSWLQSQDEAHCPLCRCAIIEPKLRGGKSFEEIANGFPTDLAMAAMVDAERLLNQDHQCCVCEDVAATSLCLNCGDMLCTACKKVHGKLSATRHHLVEDLSSLTADKLAVNRPAPCAVHADKTCELFCPTHGLTICHVCATSRHRSCPEVKDLEEEAEQSRTLLAELVTKLTAAEAELDRAIDQLDQHLQETEKRSLAAIAEIEAMCDRLESAVKACRRRLKELTLSACSEVKEAVHVGKTCLLQRKGRVTSHKRVVQRAEGMKMHNTITSMASTINARVNDLDCSTTLLADVKVISKVTLVLDPKAIICIEEGLSKLGQVKVTADVTTAVQCAVLQFHDNHGKNITLTNNGQTAERKGSGSDGGIVVCSQPMMPNKLYEVCLDKTDKPNYTINHGYVGVTTTGPDTLTLPNSAWSWASAAVIRGDSVWMYHKSTKSAVGNKLKTLTANSRIGLLIDDKRSLHLFINDEDQGVASLGVSDPCFAFFEVFGDFRQVTALPVQNMK